MEPITIFILKTVQQWEDRRSARLGRAEVNYERVREIKTRRERKELVGRR